VPPERAVRHCAQERLICKRAVRAADARIVHAVCSPPWLPSQHHRHGFLCTLNAREVVFPCKAGPDCSAPERRSDSDVCQRGELPRLMEQVRGVNMKRIIDLCVSSVMFSSAPLWLSGAFFIWADYVGL